MDSHDNDPKNVDWPSFADEIGRGLESTAKTYAIATVIVYAIVGAGLGGFIWLAWPLLSRMWD